MAEEQDFYRPREEHAGGYGTGGSDPSNTRGEPAGKDSPRGSKTPGKDDLKQAEKNGGEPTDDAANTADGEGANSANQDAGSFYKPGAFGLTRGQRIFLHRNRKKILGGGVVGTILSLVLFFTIASGPAQFIQFGKLLEQFHMTSQTNVQDNRFLKQVRFWRYYSKGEVEKTRLGVLGNKFANSYESKLNAVGLKSAYTDNFGLLDGYVIDRSVEPYKDMTDTQIKEYVKDTYGVEPVKGSEISGSGKAIANELVIDTSKMGYFDSYKLTFSMLKSADVQGLSSAIGTRLLGKRAAFVFSPLSKIVGSLKRTTEQVTKDRVDQIKNGQEQKVTAKSGVTDPKDPTASTADERAASANDTLGKASQIETSSETDPGALASGTSKIFKSGSAITGAFALGVACIGQNIDTHAGQIKQQQVRLPLYRQGLRVISTMSEVLNGQNFNSTVLKVEDQQLHGKTLVNGKQQETSWYDAQSIQANLGHPNQGVAADDTLKNINNDSTPFHFLNKEPIRTSLNVVCNPAVAIISFLGASVEDLVISAIAAGFTPLIQQQFVAWVSNQAIDPNAVGADLGLNADYGMAIASGDMAVASGGRPLSSADATTLNNFNNAQYQADFASKNIAYKLFNTTDPRSAIAKVIDHTSPSVSQNIASLGSGLLNITHSFGSLFNLFSSHAAATTNSGYDYGIPAFGFSSKELSDSRFANPYENACYISGCPDHKDPQTGQPIQSFLVDSSGNLTPDGNNYISHATACFGVDVKPDTSGSWDVTNDPATFNKAVDFTSDDYKHKFDCDDSSGTPSGLDPTKWERLRFFILDTETANSMGCYDGDNEACSDTGFDSGNDTPGGGNPGGTPGTYTNPLRDVNNLTAMRVDQGVDYGGSGPVYAIGNGTLKNINNSGWAVEGGPPTFIVYQLSDGPASGDYVYVAENCIPSTGLQIGQQVTSSTILCNMVDAAPHIETGWADSTFGEALAHSVWGTAVDDESHYTAYGRNFSDLLQSLGAPAGTIRDGAQELGSLPNGWPTW